MKKKNYIIRITKPCSENWQEMSVEQKGKYCLKCKKNVVDFTQTSDTEIIRILANTKTKVCGRFRVEQINRPLKQVPDNKKIFLAKLAAGLLLFSPSDLPATKKPTNHPLSLIEFKGVSDNTTKIKTKRNPLIDSTGKNILGKILNSKTGKALPFAQITLIEINQTTMSDSTGFFNLQLPSQLSYKKITLLITCQGYKTIKVHFKRNKIPNSLKITLVPEAVLMGDAFLE